MAQLLSAWRARKGWMRGKRSEDQVWFLSCHQGAEVMCVSVNVVGCVATLFSNSNWGHPPTCADRCGKGRSWICRPCRFRRAHDFCGVSIYLDFPFFSTYSELMIYLDTLSFYCIQQIYLRHASYPGTDNTSVLPLGSVIYCHNAIVSLHYLQSKLAMRPYVYIASVYIHSCLFLFAYLIGCIRTPFPL